MFNRATSGRNGAGGNARQVCPFYLEGRCKFGDGCRNYHPPQSGSMANSNRFGALSNSNANRGQQQLPYGLNSTAIRSDFTVGDDRPIWPLSAYGPGKDAPRQLVEGSLEQSPEELRVQYYLERANGNPQLYEQTERTAIEESERQAQKILSDIDGAVKYVMDAKDVHPNREDMVQKPAGNFKWSTQQTTTLSSSTPQPVFGQSSNFGTQRPTMSTFGQPSAPGPSSAFGQPSNLGSGSAFGKPSIVGSNFGQSSAAGSGSVFGQPSAPGPGSTFGQPSNPGPGTAFGQATSLGSGSAFGKPTALSGNTAFGQSPAQNRGASPFTSAGTGGNAFGQPSNLGAGASTFGKPSPFANQSATTASANPSPFGSSSQPSANGTVFGQASSFGQPSALTKSSPFGASAPSNNTTFGRPSSGNAQSSPFNVGQPSGSSAPSNAPAFQSAMNSGQQQNAFGNDGRTAFGAVSNGNRNITTGSQPTSASNAAQNTPLANFKGRPVQYLRVNPNESADTSTAPFYQNAQGKRERVWFPDGPPGPNTDAEGFSELYQGNVGATLKQLYDFAQQNGTFKDAFVPEIPPKRDWVSFEL